MTRFLMRVLTKMHARCDILAVIKLNYKIWQAVAVA